MSSLTEVIVAVLTTVGIAVVISIALTLAGSLYRRETVPAKLVVSSSGPIQHPTQSDDARELVLR